MEPNYTGSMLLSGDYGFHEHDWKYCTNVLCVFQRSCRKHCVIRLTSLIIMSNTHVHCYTLQVYTFRVMEIPLHHLINPRIYLINNKNIVDVACFEAMGTNVDDVLQWSEQILCVLRFWCLVTSWQVPNGKCIFKYDCVGKNLVTFSLYVQCWIYTCTWRIMVILIVGKSQITPIGAPCRDKNGAGCGISGLYLWVDDINLQQMLCTLFSREFWQN